jgi:hypothetical protein
MRKILIAMFSICTSVVAMGQEKKSVVSIPTGWTCADKQAPTGKKYQICSPPAGQQGVPFFVWDRAPKVK